MHNAGEQLQTDYPASNDVIGAAEDVIATHTTDVAVDVDDATGAHGAGATGDTHDGANVEPDGRAANAAPAEDMCQIVVRSDKEATDGGQPASDPMVLEAGLPCSAPMEIATNTEGHRGMAVLGETHPAASAGQVTTATPDALEQSTEADPTTAVKRTPAPPAQLLASESRLTLSPLRCMSLDLDDDPHSAV
jgi:hypothetical protein